MFKINTAKDFNDLALSVFKHQFEHCSVYRSFCDLLYKHPTDISEVADIPFLPIEFFKTHKIISDDSDQNIIFTSSGTTGSTVSQHFVSDVSLYEQSFIKGFSNFYGNIEDYVVLALLPSYMEREGSSLIYMVNDLIKQSKQPESGFYLNNMDDLYRTLQRLNESGKQTLLIGVSFALLDFAEQYQLKLDQCVVMETGGMKGRRKELVRSELHTLLKKGFGVDVIHSEYGMTELLSQAYSKGNGIFKTPPWMKVLARDTEDAQTILTSEKTGGLNILDLANINSCSFIATQDLGRVYDDGQFEVIGRFDHSDIRGCNLMAL
ncbi:MAG: acyl transferase [Winogradskyella sp.]|nr:acyl transferase [Winogradskyella sp.]